MGLLSTVAAISDVRLDADGRQALEADFREVRLALTGESAAVNLTKPSIVR
jgi:hypothetical protein